MATRNVRLFQQVIDYTQAEEDTFATTLAGKNYGWAIIYNTTIPAIRFWNGAAFETLEYILPDSLPLATTTLGGIIPATGTPSGKYLKDDLTWNTIAGGGDMLKSENLLGLANYTTARSNLGLGTLATQDGTITDKVDKITGKGLSTNDYTTAEQTKLAGIETGANNYSLPTATDAILGGVKIGSRLSIATGVLSADVQTANDYTTVEKNKLAGIATGANVGVVPNTAITGATKTKVTYDTKGLITSGADATTADIADSLNKRYVTDVNLTVIGNTSNTNTGDQTAIPNSALATMTTKTYKGRTTGTTGTPEDVAVATLKTDLGLVKGDVGLGNVDNTTDLGKPISTVTQTALDGKAATSHTQAWSTITTPPTTLSGYGITDATPLSHTTDVTVHTAATNLEKTANKGAVSGYAPLDTAQKVPTTNLGGAGASGSNYLRGDQTWATPTASVSITQAEIDVGATPVAEASITVTDIGITTSSKIIGGVAYLAPTGKDLDELEMDALEIKFEPATGSLNVHIKGLEGYIADKFKIWYTFA